MGGNATTTETLSHIASGRTYHGDTQVGAIERPTSDGEAGERAHAQ